MTTTATAQARQPKGSPIGGEFARNFGHESVLVLDPIGTNPAGDESTAGPAESIAKLWSPGREVEWAGKRGVVWSDGPLPASSWVQLAGGRGDMVLVKHPTKAGRAAQERPSMYVPERLNATVNALQERGTATTHVTGTSKRAKWTGVGGTHFESFDVVETLVHTNPECAGPADLCAKGHEPLVPANARKTAQTTALALVDLRPWPVKTRLCELCAQPLLHGPREAAK